MLNPKNIFRSNRTSLSIGVNPMGEVIVHAPKDMPDRKIFEFVSRRADWIRARQSVISKNSFINQSVATYNTFYFMGLELTPIVDSRVKQITRRDHTLYIPAKYAPEKVLSKIEKFLRDMAKQIITERCAYYSQILRLNCQNVLVNNNKTRWGSCSKRGEIALNWRTVMIAPRLLDYVVVHEFCHLLEFNHTKNFWAVVETILPNWQELRKELKAMGWILQLFRK